MTSLNVFIPCTLHNAEDKVKRFLCDLQRRGLHNAGMEKHERLRKARVKAGIKSAADAARRLGVPYGTYSGHENGGRGIKDAELEFYAKAFKVSRAWLATGEGDPEAHNVVGVKGIISAGGSIESGDEQPDASGNLFEIEVPFSVPEDAFALQVKGDSMWPRYDPDDVIICLRPSDNPRRLLGWEAAVATPEGNRYLKRLVEGSHPGLFTLESHNAAPIRDVRLSWVSDVYGVVRAQRWHRVSPGTRKRIIKKAVQAAE